MAGISDTSPEAERVLREVLSPDAARSQVAPSGRDVPGRRRLCTPLASGSAIPPQHRARFIEHWMAITVGHRACRRRAVNRFRANPCKI